MAGQFTPGWTRAIEACVATTRESFHRGRRVCDVVRGRAIGGFAVVAYPAKYGSSGIMTFIVNQDGKVYQSDLGPQTTSKALSMELFDPAKRFTPVKQ